MTKDDIIKAAAKGGGLPEGLGPADTFLFLSLRALYDYAKYGDMDKEQGVKEKNAILRQYEKMDLWVRVVEEHRRKEREFEGAWIDFAKEPSLENADKLHRAWFRAGVKVPKQEETE